MKERKGESKVAIMNPYNYAKPKDFVLQNKKQNISRNQLREVTASKSKQDAYLVQKIMNAKPQELTLMLYEGLVKFIKLAKYNLEKGNVEAINENSKRAQDIVDELSNTLNMDYEISESLSLLYDYVNRELFDANIKKDEKHFDNALEIAEDMAYTWREMIKQI